ncbi:NifU family protein [soil metagenome]
MSSPPQDLPARIDALLEELGDDPRVAVTVERLVRLLSQLYEAGLQALVDALMADQPGRRRLEEVATTDELLLSLLVLHDLHPLSAMQRANVALDRVRPHLGSHAGGVEVLSVTDGVAHLALQGSCDGCPASSLTVKSAIEGAILAAVPEVAEVVVDGEVEPPSSNGLLQITRPGAYTVEDCPV